MNAAIEFHDSKLLGIDETGGAVILRLSAYVHRSTGQPGRDAGTGWSQQVELVFAGGVVEHRPTELPPFTLEDGQVTGGIEQDGEIPVPVSIPAAVRFDGHGLYGERLVVSGIRLEVRATGEAVYVESFPGS